MPLSRKQAVSIRDATAPVNIWDGSIRAGKSLAANLKWMEYVLNAPKGNLAILGKTRDTIGRNVLTAIDETMPEAITWRQGAPTCRIFGRPVHLIGFNDSKAETKLRGLTLAGALVDELTLCDELFFQTLLGRLSVDGSQLFATTNPDNPMHWLRQQYLKRIGELGWAYWHFTMHDNPSLSEERIARYARELTGLWYRRMVLGEWIAAQGAIYDTFDPDVHVGPVPDGVEIRRTLVGVDYGTQNATAAVLLGAGTDRRLYVLSEWRHDPSAGEARWTDAQLSAGVREWLTGCEGSWPSPEWIMVDPSAASFSQQLWHDGLSNVDKADNAVGDGIRETASLLAIYTLRIVEAPGLCAELPGYSWDPDKAAKGIDEPIKINDHSCDALRYGVRAAIALWGSDIKTGVMQNAAA